MNNLTFSPEAVAALQALVAPNWVDIGGLSSGLAQCGLIYYGLRLMSSRVRGTHSATHVPSTIEAMTALRWNSSTVSTSRP